MFYGIAGLDYGVIVSETGNMFSGKTTALISRIDKIKRINEKIKEASIRENRDFKEMPIGIFKHSIDKRYSVEQIVTHNGISINAIPINAIDELVKEVEENDFRIIAIDEVQFFDEVSPDGRYRIEEVLKKFADEKRYVMVAGLDVDFRGLNFGPMGSIIAISDERSFHKSICSICGAPATMPQRLINGSPANFNDPIKMVGAKESYEPRCRTHHIVNI